MFMGGSVKYGGFSVMIADRLGVCSSSGEAVEFMGDDALRRVTNTVSVSPFLVGCCDAYKCPAATDDRPPCVGLSMPGSMVSSVPFAVHVRASPHTPCRFR